MTFTRHFLFSTALFASLAFGALSCLDTVPPPRIVPKSMLPTEHADGERARALEVTVKCEQDIPDVLDLNFKSRRRGSGAIVGDRFAMTAEHVIDCGPLARVDWVIVETVDNAWPVRVVQVGEGDSDVALLEIDWGADNPGTSFEHVLAKHPFRGVGLAQVDRPLCVATAIPWRRRRCGLVDGIVDRRAYLSYPGDFGNSGSGVYNERGEFVGVLTHLTRCSTGQSCGSIVETRFTAADMVDFVD